MASQAKEVLQADHLERFDPGRLWAYAPREAMELLRRREFITFFGPKRATDRLRGWGGRTRTSEWQDQISSSSASIGSSAPALHPAMTFAQGDRPPRLALRNRPETGRPCVTAPAGA